MKGWFSPENIAKLSYTAYHDGYQSTIEYFGLDNQTLEEDMSMCPFCGRPTRNIEWSRTEGTNVIKMTFEYDCVCIFFNLTWRNNMKNQEYVLSLFGVDIGKMQL